MAPTAWLLTSRHKQPQTPVRLRTTSHHQHPRHHQHLQPPTAGSNVFSCTAPSPNCAVLYVRGPLRGTRRPGLQTRWLAGSPPARTVPEQPLLERKEVNERSALASCGLISCSTAKTTPTHTSSAPLFNMISPSAPTCCSFSEPACVSMGSRCSSKSLPRPSTTAAGRWCLSTSPNRPRASGQTSLTTGSSGTAMPGLATFRRGSRPCGCLPGRSSLTRRSRGWSSCRAGRAGRSPASERRAPKRRPRRAGRVMGWRAARNGKTPGYLSRRKCKPKGHLRRSRKCRVLHHHYQRLRPRKWSRSQGSRNLIPMRSALRLYGIISLTAPISSGRSRTTFGASLEVQPRLLSLPHLQWP